MDSRLHDGSINYLSGVKSSLESISVILTSLKMSFAYKRVLLVGATAGIGAAFADKLILEGAKVIAVGRRQERLDAFVQKHGQEKASGVQYDVNDRTGMDAFVEG